MLFIYVVVAIAELVDRVRGRRYGFKCGQRLSQQKILRANVCVRDIETLKC
jgi:hypothetical protein